MLLRVCGGLAVLTHRWLRRDFEAMEVHALPVLSMHGSEMR